MVARSRTLGRLYFKQSEENYIELLSLEELDGLNPLKHGDDGYWERSEKKDRALVTTIVFSAMCLEAAGYDFVASHLGDQFAEKYLEKLDPVARWVVGLRLICGYQLPRSSAVFEAMSRTIRARNNLVHVKSESVDFKNLTAQVSRLEAESRKTRLDADFAYDSVGLLSLTCQRFAEKAAYHLPMKFLGYGPEELDPIPLQVRPRVGRWRSIVSAMPDTTTAAWPEVIEFRDD